MRLWRLFSKKTEEETKPVEETEKKSKEGKLLERICADEPEIYDALCGTLLLNIELARRTTIEEAVKREDYFLAGGLALYAGNGERAKACYKKHVEQLPGRSLKIVELSDEGVKRAVEKAREFYERLKETKGE